MASVLPLAAQRQNSLPRNLLPPELMAQPRLTQQERETIQRALADMQSDKAEMRVGAVMLLSKYHANEAKKAVVEALNDPNARVRRAAVVSIAEWRHGLPVEAVEPVLLHIADEDVEVRRSVSSIIPQMMSIMQMASMIRPDFGNRPLSPEVRRALMGAYHDEDAVVRRNILTNSSNLNLSTPPEVFVEMLDDSDRGVRLEAIPLAIGYGNPVQWTKPAQKIIEGDDTVAQLRLTAELGRRGLPEGIELLRQISQLDNLEIAAEAHLSLFRWTGEPPELDWLIKALVADRLTQDQAQRLLQMLRNYEGLAAPLAPALTELRSSVLRLEAVRLFVSLDLAEQYPEIMARILMDSNQEIRAMGMTQYYVHPELVNDEIIDGLIDNPHADVRAALVQLAIRQPRAEAEGLLYDLMLDEAVDVRIAALETISTMRLEGWPEVVSASLEDQDIAMQRTAVVIMLRERQFPRRDEILREFVEKNPKNPLTPRIRTEIGQGEIIEIDMNKL
ncbi:HEAT repeat domain-containing protein [Cerasicoccus arenae]|uniref:HEAT repeat domain-containing protein n=1 Tax=Cerasicoccus arenae TaxID=424488 RepID=UPI00188D8065|nr:HEAT repeat domain-containing protein [Cerasicoccus arenae]MBK1859079.1 HEAT repeat domain-containing protein [Cerasicoccus arenae]